VETVVENRTTATSFRREKTMGWFKLNGCQILTVPFFGLKSEKNGPNVFSAK